MKKDLELEATYPVQVKGQSVLHQPNPDFHPITGTALPAIPPIRKVYTPARGRDYPKRKIRAFLYKMPEYEYHQLKKVSWQLCLSMSTLIRMSVRRYIRSVILPGTRISARKRVRADRELQRMEASVFAGKGRVEGGGHVPAPPKKIHKKGAEPLPMKAGRLRRAAAIAAEEEPREAEMTEEEEDMIAEYDREAAELEPDESEVLPLEEIVAPKPKRRMIVRKP